MNTMMGKGKIIFLNGVTSSGKTTIVDALQARRDVFFYVVANDLFQEMVGEQYLEEDYWKYLSEVIIMMYHTAKLYSDMGKNVLIDGILVERDEIKPHYIRLLEIMKDNPLDIVEVYCPLDICRQRNIERGDRYESQSDEQAALMNPDISYRLRVDTSKLSPEECADAIVREVFDI
ncbi:adenylylsulfate kinase [Lachnospiraceae bacterium XBB2008]|nr:adenylylsulfate kinase [Lachnospiraceae bacterium XBB2008]